MIGKSFIVSIISVIIFLCMLALLTCLVRPGEFDEGQFLLLLFYGSATLIPLVFGTLFLLNLVVQWRIKAAKASNSNTVYFLYSIIFAVLPVMGFVIFDYAQRGRYFEEKTFLSITKEYAAYFALAVFTIFVNRKIVWNNFRNMNNGA